MPYVYILECGDGSYYTGSTPDLERRLAQHEAGEGANFTAKRLPIKLVYSEEFPLIGIAFQREKQIQGWTRAKKKALIEANEEALKDSAKKKRWHSSRAEKREPLLLPPIAE